ncbi:MAG: hypothetical protein MESAZ_02932 [Saezia sanguinis]
MRRPSKINAYVWIIRLEFSAESTYKDSWYVLMFSQQLDGVQEHQLKRMNHVKW